MSEEKKRKVRMAAVFGAVGGAVLAVALYLVAAPNLLYFAFVPIAAAMAAGQVYISPERK